jgi:hypothetical protein
MKYSELPNFKGELINRPYELTICVTLMALMKMINGLHLSECNEPRR